jgi:type IV secretory pathway VirB10-like protein
MNAPAYILAARDSGWIEIIVIAIVFGLSIISSLFQKAKAKEKEAKARKPRAEPRQRQTPRPRTRTVQPTRPAPPTPPAVPPAEQTVRVAEELRLRQQREAQLERERQKRLAARTSPEADSDAIAARLVSVHPDQIDTATGKITELAGIPGLRTPADARRAIILHEIFSLPKALRKDGEMWDT